MTSQTKRFLLCHSPKDADGKAELMAHLAPSRGSVSVWTLDAVLPGDPGGEAVEEAAKGAEVALLLLSADFFAELDDPRFSEQVNELRRQHKERKLRLVPILWRPCDWRAVDWLAKLVPLPGDGAAIAPYDKAQRDQLWVEVSRQLGGRGKVIVRGFLGSLRPEVGVVMPHRATLIAKSRNLLEISEADFEKVVDLAIGIQQVPQLVRAQHVPHGGARDPMEPRTLEEPLLDYLLRVERLLLVGQPGSGKTKTLRTLCGQLLEIAKEDPSLPVPFVVNLSTFSLFRGSLRDWLAEGLKESAAIPVAIGKALLEQGNLFLLLDGLDEMAAERRGRALSELNALLSAADPALARCVVCSRTMEYAEAGIHLMLPAALELQPLLPSQLRKAVEQAGPLAAPLRVEIIHDQTLATLLQTPLMLTIAVRAFAGTLDCALVGHSSANLRQLLYEAYAVQMLRRPATTPTQQASLTLRWIRWLAQHLAREESSLFLIERMQPTILTKKYAYQIVYKIVLSVAFGLVTGLFCGFNAALVDGPKVGMVVVLFSMVLSGLFGGIIGRLRPEKMKPIEHLRWSWAQAAGSWKPSLFIMLFYGLLFWRRFRAICGQRIGMVIGMIIGPCFGLGVLIVAGWMKAIHPQSAYPNEGIRALVRSGLRVGVGGGLIVGGLALGLALELGFGLARGLTGGVVGGLFAGLGLGLTGGLGEALNHYILRMFLWREGKLPLLLVPWLESCRSRLLLRRQGGAYLFWHKTLQDYFAELDDARLADLAKRIEAKPEYVQSY